MSGYGGYEVNPTIGVAFNSSQYGNGIAKKYNNKIVITRTSNRTSGANNPYLYVVEKDSNLPSHYIKVTGLPEGWSLIPSAYATSVFNTITKDGIYELSEYKNNLNRTAYPGFSISDTNNTDCNITIEVLPKYQGALVSDGVDDYGLCENFPIFTSEKGFTICAIRTHLYNNESNSAFISKSSKGGEGEFIFENNSTLNNSVYYSFGGNTNMKTPTLFSYQTSKNVNGKSIIPGSPTQFSNNLYLYNLRNGSNRCSVALYALEIYDRDLTDEEIAKVKARMIAEYEEKTGNKYEEETV